MDYSWTNRRLGGSPPSGCPKATPSIVRQRGSARSSGSADGDVPASARARDGRRAGDRRPPARERRGGREAPPAPVRGRRHGAEPPADERALARRAGRLDRRRVVRGSSSVETRSRRPSGTGPCSRSTSVRCAGSAPTCSRRVRSGRARCRGSARGAGSRPLGEVLQDQRLVAGIGNMWMSETLWAVRLSPWLPLAEAATRSCWRRCEWARTAMRAVGRGRAPGARRVPPRRAAVPPLRDADRVPRTGRRQPHGLLVPGVPAGPRSDLWIRFAAGGRGTFGG